MDKTKYDLLSKETIKKYIIDEKNKLVEHIDTIPVSYALAIVQVGDNAASNRYIAGKLKDCAEIGIDTMHVKLSEEISENSFKRAIIDLNKSKFICGIIIQKPLPEHCLLYTSGEWKNDKKNGEGAMVWAIGKH